MRCALKKLIVKFLRIIMKYKAVIFDLNGTTVLEKDPQLVLNCFEYAFKDHGISVTKELIKNNRGKDKHEMIKIILQETNHSVILTESILFSFKEHLQKNLNNFSENYGFRELLKYLKENKIKVGIGTGFPREIFDGIFSYLKWELLELDYIGIAEEIGKGRPHPDMIFDMMDKLNIKKNELLKVGDTAADIQEGKNAGVATAVILSGTQEEDSLRKENPDFEIRTLIELKEIIN